MAVSTNKIKMITFELADDIVFELPGAFVSSISVSGPLYDQNNVEVSITFVAPIGYWSSAPPEPEQLGDGLTVSLVDGND